jgi:hypothetical protein
MINRYVPLHAGTQPIRVLQFNIPAQFENTNPDFISLTLDTVATKGLQLGIAYVMNEDAILAKVNGHLQTPFVDGKGKIHVHESFLSYVWCVSFSLWVLYDEAVAKPSQNKFLGYEKNIINNNLIEQTQQLFDYGLSIIRSFSKWNRSELPNPELYPDEMEFYVGRANGIFVNAVNFILCHEFAHVEREHITQIKMGSNTHSHILMFEKEADKRAIELMLDGATEQNRYTRQLGILVGLCCLLFFKKETTGAPTHPDVDDRIHGYLTALNLDSESPLWGVAAMAIRLWDRKFSVDLQYPATIADFKEMYQSLRDQIVASKN